MEEKNDETKKDVEVKTEDISKEKFKQQNETKNKKEEKKQKKEKLKEEKKEKNKKSHKKIWIISIVLFIIICAAISIGLFIIEKSERAVFIEFIVALVSTTIPSWPVVITKLFPST